MKVPMRSSIIVLLMKKGDPHNHVAILPLVACWGFHKCPLHPSGRAFVNTFHIHRRWRGRLRAPPYPQCRGGFYIVHQWSFQIFASLNRARRHSSNTCVCLFLNGACNIFRNPNRNHDLSFQATLIAETA